MSIEQLLFFLLLVAFPLITRLIRAMGTRTPSNSHPTRDEQTVSRPRSAVSVPDAGTTAPGKDRTVLPPPLPPALPQVIQHVAPGQLRAFDREPYVRRERKRGPTTLDDGDLRRAIVLIAIVGPCRALEPKNGSELG
jgi:hypothetical protein